MEDTAPSPKRRCTFGVGAESRAKAALPCSGPGPSKRLLPTAIVLNATFLTRNDVSELFTTATHLAFMGFPYTPESVLKGALVAVPSSGGVAIRRIIAADNSGAVRVEGRVTACLGETYALSCLLECEPSYEQWDEAVAEAADLMLRGQQRHLTTSEVFYTTEHLWRLRACKDALQLHFAQQQPQQQQQQQGQEEGEALREELYRLMATRCLTEGDWARYKRGMEPWSDAEAKKLVAVVRGPSVAAAATSVPANAPQLPPQAVRAATSPRHRQQAEQQVQEGEPLRQPRAASPDPGSEAQRQAALSAATAAVLMHLGVGIHELPPELQSTLSELRTERLLALAANGGSGVREMLEARQHQGLPGAAWPQPQPLQGHHHAATEQGDPEPGHDETATGARPSASPTGRGGWHPASRLPSHLRPQRRPQDAPTDPRLAYLVARDAFAEMPAMAAAAAPAGMETGETPSVTAMPLATAGTATAEGGTQQAAANDPEAAAAPLHATGWTAADAGATAQPAVGTPRHEYPSTALGAAATTEGAGVHALEGVAAEQAAGETYLPAAAPVALAAHGAGSTQQPQHAATPTQPAVAVKREEILGAAAGTAGPSTAAARAELTQPAAQVKGSESSGHGPAIEAAEVTTATTATPTAAASAVCAFGKAPGAAMLQTNPPAAATAAVVRASPTKESTDGVRPGVEIKPEAAMPAAEAAATSAAEPVAEPAAGPAATPASETAATPAARPAGGSATRLPAEAAATPATEPATESAARPSAEAAAQPATASAAMPAAGPAVQATTVPGTELAIQSAAATTAERATPPAATPTAQGDQSAAAFGAEAAGALFSGAAAVVWPTPEAELRTANGGPSSSPHALNSIAPSPPAASAEAPSSFPTGDAYWLSYKPYVLKDWVPAVPPNKPVLAPAAAQPVAQAVAGTGGLSQPSAATAPPTPCTNQQQLGNGAAAAATAAAAEGTPGAGAATAKVLPQPGAGAATAASSEPPSILRHRLAGAEHWLTQEPSFMEFWVLSGPANAREAELGPDHPLRGLASAQGFRSNRPALPAAAPACPPVLRLLRPAPAAASAFGRYATAPPPIASVAAGGQAFGGASSAAAQTNAGPGAAAVSAAGPSGSAAGASKQTAAGGGSGLPGPLPQPSTPPRTGTAPQTPRAYSEVASALADAVQRLVSNLGASSQGHGSPPSGADREAEADEDDDQEEEQAAGTPTAGASSGGAGGRGRPPKHKKLSPEERKWAFVVYKFLQEQPGRKATYGDIRRPPCSRGVPRSVVPPNNKGRLLKYLAGFKTFWRVKEVLRGSDDICVLEALPKPGVTEEELTYQQRLYDFLLGRPCGVLLDELVRSEHKIPSSVLKRRGACSWLQAHSKHFILVSNADGRPFIRARPDARP